VIQKRHLKVFFSGEWWHWIAIDGLSAIERLVLVSKIDRWRQYIIAGDHGVVWHFNRLTAKSRMLVNAERNCHKCHRCDWQYCSKSL
jgi:hypothetical protein